MKTVRSLFIISAAILIPLHAFAAAPQAVSFMGDTSPEAPVVEMMPNPNPPVILRADPNINLNRVPPPRRFQLRAPATATIQVNFLPPGSPAALWGDITIAWPTDASNALVYAAGIWEALLTSTVPITINAGWVSNLGVGVLGHSGSVNFFRNFASAPVADTWYPVTLANAISGTDQDPGDVDIYMGFSSTFSWYTGTDGNTPGSQYDLVSVVLHEICHGLGFAGSMDVSGGLGSWGGGTGYPIAYDRFAEDNAGTSLLDTGTYPNNSVALANALTSGNIFFDGTHANAANGGTRVPLYAPATWNDGSSFSHLDESYNSTPNALMTYSLGFGESEHSPGPVTMGLLQDVGWTGGGVVTQTYTLSIQSQDPNSGVNISVTPNDNGGLGNGTTPFTRVYNDSTAVMLNAPATAGGNAFIRWEVNSVDQGNNPVLNVTMDANKTASAVYSSAGTTTGTYTVSKLKGKIFWKAGPLYSKGDLMIKGSIPVTLTDLTHFQNYPFASLMIINGILPLPSGDYVGINGKGTVVKYKTVNKASGLKIITKLKLKDGVLYVIWKSKKIILLPIAFGITDTDTPGWVIAPANIVINATAAGYNVLGLSTSGINYQTKSGKKTSIK